MSIKCVSTFATIHCVRVMLRARQMSRRHHLQCKVITNSIRSDTCSRALAMTRMLRRETILRHGYLRQTVPQDATSFRPDFAYELHEVVNYCDHRSANRSDGCSDSSSGLPPRASSTSEATTAVMFTHASSIMRNTVSKHSVSS